MKKLSLLLLASALLILAGCATSIVPPALQSEVVPGLDLATVKENRAAHMGQVVLWGGLVVKTINKKRGTLIEVLQLPLDYQERPKQVHDSQGRFIVSMKGFLDPEIYKHGKEITVVGRVAGVETLPLGEIDYTYVLLRGDKVHLWPPRPVKIRYDGFGPPIFIYGAGPRYWYTAPYYWW